MNSYSDSYVARIRMPHNIEIRWRMVRYDTGRLTLSMIELDQSRRTRRILENNVFHGMTRHDANVLEISFSFGEHDVDHESLISIRNAFQAIVEHASRLENNHN